MLSFDMLCKSFNWIPSISESIFKTNMIILSRKKLTQILKKVLQTTISK